MTTYPLDTPDWLWEAYKETVSHAETLDEPLKSDIAERVAASNAVDPDTRERAEAYLNGNHP